MSGTIKSLSVVTKLELAEWADDDLPADEVAGKIEEKARQFCEECSSGNS